MSRIAWLFAHLQPQESRRLAPGRGEIDFAALEDRLLYSATPLVLDVPTGADGAPVEASDPMLQGVALLASTLDGHGDTSLTATDLAIDPGDTNLTDTEHSVLTTLNQLDALTQTNHTADPAFVPDNHLTIDAIEHSGVGDGPTTVSERLELIFVDTSVPDYDDLVHDIVDHQDAGHHYEVILLDGQQDGIQAISDQLDAHHDVDAIHLISHGTDSAIQLGNTWLDQHSLQEHSEQIQHWQSSLSDHADILIYGCDIAATEDGHHFLSDLGELTGADIAASDDLTGHDALHGDWDLEFTYGHVETSIVFSAHVQDDWHHVLSTFVVTTTANSGAGSLRDAINAANSHIGVDTITFNIGGGGAQTISISSWLPEITDAVIIDGTTQAGYNNAPLITLDGSASLLAVGLNLSAGNSTVRGLAIENFDLSGLYIHGGGHNVIQGMYIGTHGSGVGDFGNGLTGIYVDSSDNVIGGTLASERNIIVGNGTNGIQIAGVNASNNIVQGNYIGVGANGSTALGNSREGIFIDRASHNRIENNVISGNSSCGIRIEGISATDNLISANLIGTSATGMTAVANGDDGIHLVNGSDNRIENNTISGNTGDGIDISGSSAECNAVFGNRIGTTVTGLSSLGNGGNGILIQAGAYENTIGSISQGNIISYNQLGGVVLRNDTGAESQNSIRGNLIFNNAGREIDLNNDGVTINDALDADQGANGLQNSPVINFAMSDGSGSHVAGTIQGVANSDYSIDLYASQALDSSGSGQSEIYLGSTMVHTDATGVGRWDIAVQQTLASSMYVSTIATDTTGNSSEFSIASVVSEPKVYFIQRGAGIHQVDFAGLTSPASLVAGISKPGDLVVDAPSGKMYWTDQQSSAIKRANLDGTGVETVVSGLNKPMGLYLDSTSAKLYWADELAQTITRSNLDGSNIQTLVTATNATQDVTVDAVHGKIYWTEKSTSAIWTANMDGSSATCLVSLSNSDPHEIEVDSEHGFLYWTDKQHDAIYRCDLNGANVTVVASSLSDPYGLAVDRSQGHLFWTETTGSVLKRANLDGTNVTTIATGVGNSFGVEIAQAPQIRTGPILDVLRGVTVAEGGAVDITHGKIHASDIQQGPAQLVYSLSQTPSHGHLEYTSAQGVAITTFTQQDIDSGLLRYVHNGDETISDRLSFTVSDGTESYSGSINVSVTPVDDAPVLATNQLTLQEGQTIVLSASTINATDIDSANVSLVYTVSNVQAGRFERSTAPGVAIITFTKAQVTAGQIRFVHDGTEADPNYRVAVTDGNSTLAPANANITFAHVNDAPIVDTNSGLNVVEGGLATISAAKLHVSDAEQSAGQLRFTVVQSPLHGRVELTGQPGVAVSSFTQQDIDSGRLRYVHDGSETTNDSLRFSVTDGIAVVNRTLAISVTPVNDAPVWANHALSITEGQSVVVTTNMLGVTDADTAASALRYTVVGVSNGYFESSLKDGIAVTSFTQQEIANGSIRFVHDGSNVAPAFTVSVSDGTTRLNAVSGNVTFQAVNDAPVATSDSFQVSNTGQLSLTSAGLLQNDLDEEGTPLTIAAISAPSHGTLAVAASGQWVYTPDENFIGVDKITYQSSDGVSLSNVASITILVLPDAGSQVIQLPTFSTASAVSQSVVSQGEAPDTIESTVVEMTDVKATAHPGGVVNLVGLAVASPSSADTDEQSDGKDVAALTISTLPITADDNQLNEATSEKSESLVSHGHSVRHLRSGAIGSVYTAQPSERGSDVPTETAQVAAFFHRQLDGISQALNEQSQIESMRLGTIASGATAMSVGYVVWILRGSYLFTSLVTQMPAWRLIDPLPIFDCFSGRAAAAGGESLEQIVAGGARADTKSVRAAARSEKSA